MVNEYLTRAYDTKVIFRELLCFYAPFGWVPVKENRAPNPNPPVHKMYDGNTVWSMEKQDYVSDYDVGRKRSEKIVVKRNTKFTRNNRLMTEEALMEYHLRWRYWLYPRCNRLRLINRCRPGWGILWSILLILFMFSHLVISFHRPVASTKDILFNDTDVTFTAENETIYSLNNNGPYFMFFDNDLYYSEDAKIPFEPITDEQKKNNSLSVSGKTLTFNTGIEVNKVNKTTLEMGSGDYESYKPSPTQLTVTVQDKVIYSLSQDGPFYFVDNGTLYISDIIDGVYSEVTSAVLRENGLTFSNNKLIFSKDTKGKLLLGSSSYSVDRTSFNGFNSPAPITDEPLVGVIECTPETGVYYTLSENSNGPFFTVIDGTIYIVENSSERIREVTEEEVEFYGITYAEEKLSFSKDSTQTDVDSESEYMLYKATRKFKDTIKASSTFTKGEIEIPVTDGIVYSMGYYYMVHSGRLYYATSYGGPYKQFNDPTVAEYSGNRIHFYKDAYEKDLLSSQTYLVNSYVLETRSSNANDLTLKQDRHGRVELACELDKVYALDRVYGPYFKFVEDAENEKIYLLLNTVSAEPYNADNFVKITAADAEKYGIKYKEDSTMIAFFKSDAETLFAYAHGKSSDVNSFVTYVIDDSTFGMVYKIVYEKPVEWMYETLNISFNLISSILAAFFLIMFVYQLFSNRMLKKNTERIIECCVNGKAIVKAMQYEDITLMNGRQRQRYYQGQVINEAARNTGDPLYFGS